MVFGDKIIVDVDGQFQNLVKKKILINEANMEQF
jgi:hypothetical protein